MGFEPSTIKSSIFIAYGCKIVNVQQWRWVNKLWASEVASDPSLLSSAIAHNVSTRSIEASSILSSTSYSPWRRCIYVNVMVTFLSWTVINSEVLLGYPLRIWALRLPLSVVLSLSKWSKVCLHARQTQESGFLHTSASNWGAHFYTSQMRWSTTLPAQMKPVVCWGGVSTHCTIHVAALAILNT